MLIGLGGVIALVGIDIGGRGSELVGAAAVLGGDLRLRVRSADREAPSRTGDPLGPVAGALGIASIMLLPFAIAGSAETPSADASPPWPCWACLHGVRLPDLLPADRRVGPSRATIITYVNPVVALALGVAILDEQ